MTLEEHIISCLPPLLGEPRVVNTNAADDVHVYEGVIYYRLHYDYVVYLSNDFIRLFNSLFNIAPTEELIRIVFKGFLGSYILYYHDDDIGYSRMMNLVKHYTI